LSNVILKWTGKMAPHFSAFARSIDGTIPNYISRIHEDDLVEVLDLIEISFPSKEPSQSNGWSYIS